MPRETRQYRILTPLGFILSPVPGRYAGWNGGRPSRLIFGRLDCPSGKQKIHPKNRVFFFTFADAIACGYRPCKVCQPKPSVKEKRK